jgi:alpha-N-arabinofuranosidase
VSVRNLAQDGNVTGLAGLSASASLKDRRLTVTLTNPALDASLPVRIRLSSGARAQDAKGQVLTHQDMRATNNFTAPEEVKPVAHPVKILGNGLELTLPKHSVALIQCELS